MTCRAEPTTAAAGTARLAHVELENTTDATVTLAGASVPWSYHHAAHFSSGEFTDPHVMIEPGEIETLIVLPGETAGGDIPLDGRLLDGFGHSIEDVPGAHEVEMRARLTIDPDTTRRRDSSMQCRFDVVVEPSP